MTFDDLLTHDDPFLRDLAATAARYRREHDSGQLSDEAFAKLSGELTNLEARNAACDNEETREKLAEAVEVVGNFLASKL